ncbi:MAG: DEAD/DEAH box helicase [Betaproteobacteria bacterium]|nr:MAG: DEAD/DEAH box helicase [Betaproteobacteria bacterium]
MSKSFEALGLRAELVRAVADSGYTRPTPVQAQTIPIVLNGHDAIVGAQTGTGKTASFALPILQLLEAKPLTRPHIRTLILTPTRELASQVEQSICTYGRHLRLRSTSVFGGVNINPQIQSLRRGVDILVATPGRLLDHVRNRTVNLSKVESLVLDEADRMLDMGFLPDIRRILEILPKQRQNLFFSATFSRDIRKFADSFLNSPTEIAVARQNSTAERIKQVIHPVDKGSKRALLSWLIGSGDWRQVLIFTRTKHGANRLADQLGKDGISAAALHGNKSQGARTKALAGFKRGAVRALVATDIAARGLDIKELPHVVNYELPNVPEDYVHRIGRTGRAGSDGAAISLVCGEERSLLANIERLTGNRIENVIVAGFEPSPLRTANEKHQAEDKPNKRRPRRSSQKRPSKDQSAGNARKASERTGRVSPGTSTERPGGDAQAKQPGKPRDSATPRRRRPSKSNRAPSAARAHESDNAPSSQRFLGTLRAVTELFGGRRHGD